MSKITNLPNLNKITAEDLVCNTRLSFLYYKCVELKWWPNSDKAALDFWCLAEKALHDAKEGTSGRLFYALVKHKDTSRVTEAMEGRAMSRMPSQKRYELVNSAKSKFAITPEQTQEVLFGEDRNIGYMHSIMMQCFLPHNKLPDGVNRYQTNHGKASLVIKSDELANTDRVGEFEQQHVPWGSKARLLLPYINGQAIIKKDPKIDLGKSMRAFLRELGKSVEGRTGKEYTQQIKNIGAAQFILGEWKEEGTSTKYARMCKEMNFWIDKDENQHTLWTPEMKLSQEYFEAISQRPVPVDLSHLDKLTRSTRRMDIYSWLSYRLPVIKPHKEVKVPLHGLHPILAPEIMLYDDFKCKFKKDLVGISKVYRDFNVGVEKNLLVMRHSKPPIAPKNLYFLK